MPETKTNIYVSKNIKKGVCYFTFEDVIYEVPIKKCEEVKNRIRKEISSYNEKRRKIRENLIRDVGIIGVSIIITTSNGADPLFDIYANTKNNIKRILEENSKAKYKKFY